MATLARLSPESVLHNIMPVFTFMGSTVFHRDDTYSFTVVQKVRPPITVSSHGLNILADDRQYRSRDGGFAQELSQVPNGTLTGITRVLARLFRRGKSYSSTPSHEVCCLCLSFC